MTIRLFVGLTLPKAVRQKLETLQAGIPKAHWVPAANLHVTLRFIGEIDEGAAEDVHNALTHIDVSAFQATLGGLGTFGRGRRIHRLWAGLTASNELLHLQNKVEMAVRHAGLPAETRHFQPHVTLARLQDPPLARLQDFIAGNNLLKASFPVDAFQLFSSQLGHGDPVYRIEAEYLLRGSVRE
ncbi:MAG TPA: RNA 2',3'-cyclic phosphodiesterase [Rhodospirillaceae bacterium]|nr:RNA 2',3'-cyclic phosphodiesterase [Rhodospirillaceae bacterium]